MRRALTWILLGLLALTACSRDWERFEVAEGAGGAAGSDGGGGVGLGQCFPGSKLCPDPNDPADVVCVQGDQPELGCANSTSCLPCALPHAVARCALGSCAIDICGSGWDDCNGNPIDGCETDLNGDKNHCGNCATDCVASSGPGWICKAGVCELNECCPTGAASCLSKMDCDGDKQNGCEVDVSNDPANCKTCGNICSLANASSACSQGVCVVMTCSSGWANCDASDVNGCEVNVNSGDGANCGACGKKCSVTNAAATCTGGSCVLLCSAGFGNCDGNADNGCEVDVKTNPLHCNGCNKPCNPVHVQNALCKSGTCDYDSCQTGWADCDGNRTNGCEINTLQDVNHCGACGAKCTPPSGGSVVCSNGSCAAGCGSGLTNCGGTCVNTANDVNYCGSCTTKCTPPANAIATCSGGACGSNCNNGFAKCGTAQCYQTTSDPAHCCSGSGCNTSCTTCPGPVSGSGTATCSAGVCNLTCTAPTTGKCGTGCYNFASDTAHCGGCTTVCISPPNGLNLCVASTCTITCNSGYHKCANLCKADNDATACGASCQNCPGPTSGTGSATCVSGACGISCSGSTPDLCASSCVNKQTDESHCGNCGSVCGGGKTCTAGACV